MTASDTIRKNLGGHVALLASTEAQLHYERQVPHVPVHVELIESFYDSYLPGDPAFDAAFSPEEKDRLAAVDSALRSLSLADVGCVAALLAVHEWQSVIQRASEAQAALGKNA